MTVTDATPHPIAALMAAFSDDRDGRYRVIPDTDTGFRLQLLKGGGWDVSVQWHHTAHCDGSTAEVAVFRPGGEIDGDVLGWQTRAQVCAIIDAVRWESTSWPSSSWREILATIQPTGA